MVTGDVILGGHSCLSGFRATQHTPRYVCRGATLPTSTTRFIHRRNYVLASRHALRELRDHANAKPDNSTQYLIDPVSSQDNFRLHWNEGDRHE